LNNTRKTFQLACWGCLLLASCLVLNVASAATISGTLSHTTQSTTTTKSQGGGTCTTINSSYTWTFTDSTGVAHAFPGSSTLLDEEFSGGSSRAKSTLHPDDGGCNAYLEPEFNTWSTDGLYYLDATGPFGSIAATHSYFDPAYQVTSIIYAAPGNESSTGFTNSTTDGATTSVGSTFTEGSTLTYTTGSWLTGGSLSLGFGLSETTGDSNAFTETFTDATGVSLANQSTNPNAINHKQDLFLIWLNPEVSVASDGSTLLNYSVSTRSTASGTLETPDIVEVTASTMLANASGATTVPAAVLNQQVASGVKRPGLAAICANLNQAEYTAGTCSLANQCGCVPKDFAPILALDPLLNYSGTTNPTTADTSGATACAAPTASDKCRYVPVPSAQGSSDQAVETLSGPECVGCDIPVNAFTQSDANSTTRTLSESLAQTVSYTATVDFLVGSFSVADQWQWTNSESSGAINGSANSQAVSLSSSKVGCYEDIAIFEDTVFHTFVFQQPANNTSCNP